MKNIIILGLIFSIILFSGCVTKEQPKACTEEAKLCPDGSAVGRTGPDCEFAPCPEANPSQPIVMKYQPMQCNETPWQAWYKEGHIQYIMAPTEEQLITAFLSWNNITVSSVKKVDSGGMACQACYICSETYYYTMMTEQKYLEKLQQLGFSRIS